MNRQHPAQTPNIRPVNADWKRVTIAMPQLSTTELQAFMQATSVSTSVPKQSVQSAPRKRWDDDAKYVQTFIQKLKPPDINDFRTDEVEERVKDSVSR